MSASPCYHDYHHLLFDSFLTPVYLPPKVVSSKRIRDSQNEINGAFHKLDELQQLVGRQASEIERIKNEKNAAEASAAELSAQNEKVEHENKILKRAVTIQQERQNQMSSELDAARRFRVEAEDRIRRLEQVNLTLQYQLQAANSSSGNDFMGFSPRPPDVY
ncbi:hypothetical protein ACHAXS_008659 [Conticribra weissflogii]